jgi:hypothetical protein
MEWPALLDAMEILLAALFALLAAAVVYALATEWRRSSRERAIYRERRLERDAGRETRDVAEMLPVRWGGADQDRLRQMWDSLAACFDIRPEIMRMEDRIGEMTVSTGDTGRHGPDCYDLQEWVQEWCPGASRARIREIMEHEITEQTTVAELMERRRGEGEGARVDAGGTPAPPSAGGRKPPAPQVDVPPGLCGVGLVAYTRPLALRLGGMRGLGWWPGRGNGSQTFVRDRRNESSGPVGSGGEG